MSSAWDSMVAEGVTAPRSLPVNSFASSSKPKVPSSSSGLPKLTSSEREALKSAGGCYHCRRTPTSPGWVRHSSRDCPGDKSRNIPPRNPPTTSTTVASVIPRGFDRTELIASRMPGPGEYDSDDDESYRIVGAVQGCVLGNGTDSEVSHSDEDD
ncbi:hypothetical protein BDN72DRAFT_836636 [Pluteus cervinus]|uniref:Uncharacterized protein n=1 Tax=Pluteus cervinus TaxID=181527 RepID=A0ACD3B2F3_9AGAR|nr:hypothetical protein BDN72DRAFT_836636 [Pluteus cervinus]